MAHSNWNSTEHGEDDNKTWEYSGGGGVGAGGVGGIICLWQNLCSAL